MNGKGNMLTTLTLGVAGWVLYYKYREQIRPMAVKVARAGVVAGEGTKNLITDLCQETTRMRSEGKGRIQNMFKRMDVNDIKDEKSQISQSLEGMKKQLSDLKEKVDHIKEDV